jgi:hypothetical protein
MSYATIKSLSIGMRITGALWVLGWFIIFLEIFRWHHMTMWLHFSGPPPVPGEPPPRAGNFLKGSAAVSVIAPPSFAILAATKYLLAKRSRS